MNVDFFLCLYMFLIVILFYIGLRMGFGFYEIEYNNRGGLVFK